MALTATTLEETHQQMADKLDGIVPDIELSYKAELAYEINKIKKAIKSVKAIKSIKPIKRIKPINQ